MDVIAIHAERQPDKPAVIEGDRTITWSRFFEERNRLAHGLLDQGLRSGDHVVVYGHNSAAMLLAGAAIRALGAVAIPMNHRLAADEVAYILDDSDAVLAFVDDSFLPIVESIRSRAPKVRRWVLMGAERRAWGVHLDGLVAAGAPTPVTTDVGENLGGSMIYTAGTTGKPKGALRRAVDPRNVVPRLEPFGLVDPSHVHLAAGPLYHSAPGAFAVYTHVFGGTVVVMPKFDPEEALALIARHRCTSTFMAPTLLKRLVDLPPGVRERYDVSSMRVIIVAAAPCPMRVKEAMIAWFGPVLYEFYGSTELGVNTLLLPADVLRKPGSCGRAAPGVEVAVLDDDGQPLPAGTPGELFVRRYDGVFDEYWKKPDATRETTRGAWLSVGDVAWMDEDGFVYICDRKRDMVISGGVNIYPAEIEDVLHRHPQIEDVAVFGVPDDEWGERVHAAVQPRGGETLTADDVIAFARRALGGYKVPRGVSFHDALPRDSAGKLVKRLLRDPYWAGRSFGQTDRSDFR
jgi:acyl-CoA synthetase (AMP-forming)/AMP-acid ligase II